MAKTDQNETQRTPVKDVRDPADQKGAVVAQGSGGALAVVDDALLMEDAGDGRQNVRFEDLAVPYLAILQSGSPQCKKSSGEYIEGAEEGMIFNTVTKELLGNSIEVIPAYYSKKLIEWKDRETQGGGLVKIYDNPDDPIKQKTTRNEENNRDYLPNGHVLAEHAEHFVIYINKNGVVDRAVMSMTSTQLKKSRQWNTLMGRLKITTKDKDGNETSFTPPVYAFSYTAKTVPEQNDKGSWFVWDIQHKGRVSPGLYKEGKELSKAVASGAVKAAPPIDPGAEGAPGGKPAPF